MSTRGVINQVSFDQLRKEATLNEGMAAVRPAGDFGIKSAVALTLVLYDGVWPVAGIPTPVTAGLTISLTDNATSYVRMSDAGVIDVVTGAPAGWPARAGIFTALWDFTTLAGVITASNDWRFSIQSSIPSSDPELAAIAGLTSAANKVPYFTGSGTAALADFPAVGRTLAASASATDLIAGTLPAARMPAITGDVTTSAGAVAATLASTAVTPGTYGDSSHVPQITFDAKGRATGAANVTIAAGVGSIIAGQSIPVAASFTPFGSGITVTDKSDRMQLLVTAGGGVILRGQTLAGIATPYTIDMICGAVIEGGGSGSNQVTMGICLSDGTKFCGWVGGFNGSGTDTGFYAQHWTNSTTFSATVNVSPLLINPSAFAVRITDDGSNRKFWVSPNGKDYTQYFSEATNTFLTPTQFGMAAYNAGAASTSVKVSVTHWLVSASVLGDAA